MDKSTASDAQRLKDEQQMRSGASWFLWIAVLSQVNSLLHLTGSTWAFLIGLGVTQISDIVIGDFILGPTGKLLAFTIGAGVAGIFALFGVFARRGRAWSFIVGMALYGLDALLFAWAADWPSLGFHVFALFFLFRGWRACRRLAAARLADADQAVAA